MSFSGQCGGTAIITVTDAYGAKQEKAVTIPITVIIVSGPDTPTDGVQYTASGGKSPYTWSINKGSITQGGVITVSGQCGTITVTATDENGCKGTKVMDMQAEITISGPDAPTDGNQYTATGGTEPYTWAITKGSINSSTGIVTVSGQCGTATVTATDSCGNTGSKDVMMPNGRWVLTSIGQAVDCTVPGCTISGSVCFSWSSLVGFCDFITGASLTRYILHSCANAPCAGLPSCAVAPCHVSQTTTDRYNQTESYSWRCP